MKVQIKKEKEKKYKFIHILWHGTENPFFDDLVDSLKRIFPIDTQVNYFVTPYLEVFNRIKSKNVENIELVKDGNLINRYAPYAEYLVVHNLGCSRLCFLFSKDKNLKKVVWRTWGSDVPTIKEKDSIFLKHLKSFYIKIWEKKILHMKAVACANLIDKYRFQQMFSDKIPYVYFTYTKYPSQEELIEMRNMITDMPKHEGTNVLIGHSAYPADKHLEILNLLRKYSDEKVTIYVNIVYGDNSYKVMVLREVEEVYSKSGMKIIPVTKRMTKIDYMHFLNDMDICIMGMETSSAIGNIEKILFLRKKIFYSETSEFARALEANYCIPAYFQSISKMSFTEFCSKNESEIEHERKLIGYKPYDDIDRKYKDLFKEIESL